MKVSNLIMRSWTYMRRGYNIYISFPISIITSLVIWYRDVIERIPALSTYFPRLIQFFAISSICAILVSTILGYFDYKRGSVKTDGMLGAMANPVTIDSILASIYAQRGLLEHTKGNNEEATKCLEKSISILSRWCSDG